MTHLYWDEYFYPFWLSETFSEGTKTGCHRVSRTFVLQFIDIEKSVDLVGLLVDLNL
jgi:hypothetical protein